MMRGVFHTVDRSQGCSFGDLVESWMQSEDLNMSLRAIGLICAGLLFLGLGATWTFAKPAEAKKAAPIENLVPDSRGEVQFFPGADDRVVFEAPALDLKVDFIESKASAGGATLKANGAEIQKAGGLYRVRWPLVKFPENQREAETLQAQKVEIRGQSLGLDARARQIQVNVKNSKHIVILNALKIRGEISGGSGDILGHALEGALVISNREGRLKWDQQSGPLHIKDFKGDVGVSNQVGVTSVSSGSGSVKWVSLKGGLSVQGFGGQLDAQSESSSVKVADFDGTLVGKSEVGDWSLGLKPKAIVKLETIGGDIRAKVPPGSGARLDLTSEDGKLVAPSPLKASSESGFRRILGRLGGSLPGAIHVKTKNGDVSVTE